MDRIKGSLSAKIFLGIALILLAVSLLMFGMLRIFMPKTYENDMVAGITANTVALAKQLEAAPESEWETMLTQFCLANNTGAAIFDENGEQIAGLAVSVFTIEDDIVTQSEADSSAVSIAFESGGKPFTIVSYANPQAVKQITNTFAKVFPFVLLIVLVVSTLVAYFYSRFVVNMKNLQTANEKLQADIEQEREQERRRRDFFSAISHELKTPVTILKGELEGMMLNVGKFKDRDKYLGEAHETTQSIEKLVREIMTLAKLDTISLKPETVKLSDLVTDCLHKYEVLAQDKHIEIESRLEDSVTVNVDGEQMRTVLSNIIGNAVKHSPEGGHVDICVSEQDGQVELSVENSGVHIPPAKLSQVWEPFYRTDKSRSRDTGGSGLGLYIVKTILDLHGLAYRFENTESGVVFKVVF
jgi:two-component system sensor histidine kinase VanS